MCVFGFWFTVYCCVYQVPCGVAVSGQEDHGRIYVADYNNRRVVRLSRNARYDGCFVAASTSSTQLVQPQALDFATNGRLVVVDRTHVKIFDVGVRPLPADTPADHGLPDVAETPVTPPPSLADDGAVVMPDAKHRPTKPKPTKIGPKPVVPPRPKFLKELTFAAGSDLTQSAPTKTGSTSPASSSVTVSTTTTTPSSTASKTATARRASTTSVTSTLSSLETEVW